MVLGEPNRLDSVRVEADVEEREIERLTRRAIAQRVGRVILSGAEEEEEEEELENYYAPYEPTDGSAVDDEIMAGDDSAEVELENNSHPPPPDPEATAQLAQRREQQVARRQRREARQLRNSIRSDVLVMPTFTATLQAVEIEFLQQGAYQDDISNQDFEDW